MCLRFNSNKLFDVAHGLLLIIFKLNVAITLTTIQPWDKKSNGSEVFDEIRRVNTVVFAALAVPSGRFAVLVVAMGGPIDDNELRRRIQNLSFTFKRIQNLSVKLYIFYFSRNSSYSNLTDGVFFFFL